MTAHAQEEAYFMNYAIQTKNLCKEYKGELRVNHLNLNIPMECVYGFLGPNGAGKSTTMKMMLGLVKPTSGSVNILDKTLNDKNRLSILSQTVFCFLQQLCLPVYSSFLFRKSLPSCLKTRLLLWQLA